MLRFTNTIALLVTLSACSAEDGAALRVVGGAAQAEAAGDPVVSLNVTRENGSYLCTGTFVSPTTVLTAAHCVDGSAEAGGKVKEITARVAGHPVAANTWLEHPGYSRADLGTSALDLGLLVFAAPQAATPAKLRQQTPKADDEAQIVGYGVADWTLCDATAQARLDPERLEALERDFGGDVRRTGTTRLDEPEQEPSGPMLASHADLKDGIQHGASVGCGDSGGPLLIGGEVAGVASLGAAEGDRAVSRHVVLTLPANVKFLKDADAGDAEIPGIPTAEPDPLTPEPVKPQPEPTQPEPAKPELESSAKADLATDLSDAPACSDEPDAWLCKDDAGKGWFSPAFNPAGMGATPTAGRRP